jgi:hypothetical protein
LWTGVDDEGATGQDQSGHEEPDFVHLELSLQFGGRGYMPSNG